MKSPVCILVSPANLAPSFLLWTPITRPQNPTIKKLDLQLGGLLSEGSSEENVGESTDIRVAGHGLKWVSLVGIGKGSISSSSFAYLSLGESVASVVKPSPANNVVIALASSEDLTPESKLANASAI
ncbi:leucine aminopeptidase 1-like protein [Tanacetum coccineum]